MPGFDLSGLADICHDHSIGTPLSHSRAQPSMTTETARRYRYSFELLEPLDQESLLLFAYKITRPSAEIDQITIHNGQSEIYRPGKNRWLPIDITFYERIFGETDAGPDTGNGYDQPAELIYNWWAKTMIDITTSLHGPPSAYRKPGQVAMLDGLGNSIWVYYLSNCWPMKVSPSDLGYADTEIAEITITLSYDKATEKRVI